MQALIESFSLRVLAVADHHHGHHAAHAQADDSHDDDGEELPAADAPRHETALRVFHVVCGERNKHTMNLQGCHGNNGEELPAADAPVHEATHRIFHMICEFITYRR